MKVEQVKTTQEMKHTLEMVKRLEHEVQDSLEKASVAENGLKIMQTAGHGGGGGGLGAASLGENDVDF